MSQSKLDGSYKSELIVEIRVGVFGYFVSFRQLKGGVETVMAMIFATEVMPKV